MTNDEAMMKSILDGAINLVSTGRPMLQLGVMDITQATLHKPKCATQGAVLALRIILHQYYRPATQLL